MKDDYGKDAFGPLVSKVQLTVRILRTATYSSLAKVVFADLLLGYHNTDNGLCCPRARTIASGQGRRAKETRQIRDAIKELIRGGDLERKRRRAGPPVYSFPGLEWRNSASLESIQDRRESATPDRRESATPDRRESATRNTEKRTGEGETKICNAGLAAVLGSPEEELPTAPRRKPGTAVPPNTKNKKSTDGGDDFDRWYSVYPKHRSRGQARKAFERIVKAGRATVEELITGAARYAAERRGKDWQYTSYPAAWLNADGWLDEPAPQVDQPQLQTEPQRKVAAGGRGRDPWL
jgi:hypothetical protein